MNRQIAILVGIFVFLNGCSENKDDLVHYINTIKGLSSKKIEPIEPIHPLPVFKFPENDTRRDPFQTNHHKISDSNRIKQELERFSLKNLHFVGTWKQDGILWALIQKPDLEIYRIKAGQYMGQHDGRVIVITESSITIEESLNKAGIWEKRPITMHLHTGIGASL